MTARALMRTGPLCYHRAHEIEPDHARYLPPASRVRVQRFLDRTDPIARWEFDHVEQAIDALLAEDFAEGDDSMLLAEEQHLIQAPTGLDGGNGGGATLRARLSTIFVSSPD